MRMDIKKGFTVDVQSRLFNAGKTDFGEDYEAESYHVVVRRDDGKTWFHPSAYLGALVHLDEDGNGHFEDVREDAKEMALTLMGKVLKRGYIETSLWYEGTPTYGSEYFRKKERV